MTYVAVRRANAYYVDATGGLDTNTGLSPAQAWQTLAKVNGSTFTPGATILLKRGETWGERLIPPSSGSAAGYITFGSYGTGAAPVIDGTGISITDGGLVEVNNKDYIRITGLNVIDSDDFGIYAVNSSYIEVTSCTTRNTHASGIGVWTSDHITITSNTVVNARCVTLANGGHEESISLAGVTYFEVGNNDVSMDGVAGYLGNEGIDCKDGCQHGSVHHNYIHGFTLEGGSIYVDGWDSATGDIDIYCNKCWGNPNGIAINSEQGGAVSDINIFNNLVYNPYDTGIGIMTAGSDGPKSNVNIYHNTVYKNQYNGGAAIYIKSTNVEDIAIYNNITHFAGSNAQIMAHPSVMAEITCYNNLSYGSTSVQAGYIELSTNPAGYATVHDNATGNPVFVSTVTPDLHLQATSPAINTGYASGLATDYAGGARPQGGAWDKGAYELAEA